MVVIMLLAMMVAHEQVHERTNQKYQIRQRAEEMCGVFCNEKEAGDQEETDQRYHLSLPRSMSGIIHIRTLLSECRKRICQHVVGAV